MATLSDLVAAIASVQGLDESQVRWIARYLREAGLISQGGRGRGGARMREEDASNLLIGVNAPTLGPKEVAKVVGWFRELPVEPRNRGLISEESWQEWWGGEDYLSKLVRDECSFGSALDALIYEGEADVEVQMSGPIMRATISKGSIVSPRWVSFSANTQVELEDTGAPPDREVTMKFTGRTIKSVSELLNEYGLSS